MKCIVCNSAIDTFYEDLFDDRYGSPNYYTVFRCKKCGFGRIDPVLSKSKIGEFYKKYYPLSKYVASKIKSSVNIMPSLKAWLFGVNNTTHWYVKKGSKVLDIGSGSGQSLLEIQKIGGIAYGVEPDPSAQKIAKKLDLNVFKGFLSDNPFPRKKFDYVTGSQVIEHEPDPQEFLIIAKRKLAKGGKIILSFPNFDSIYGKVFLRRWVNWHVPYHVNFFTKNSIYKLAKKSGLKIVDYKTITPNIWTVIQLRVLFSKTKMGYKNPVWNQNTLSLYTRVVNLILFLLVTPINRLIDYLEMGDSILVVLEK